jgi:long-chain acyl-CoA synthetase
VQTIPEFLLPALSGSNERILGERGTDGQWLFLTAAELLTRIRAVAGALSELGVIAGDRVAIIAPNSVDWIVVDLGVIFAGCVSVPIFPTQALDQIHYILADSEAKVVFAATPDDARRFSLIAPKGIQIISFVGEGTESLGDFERRGRMWIESEHVEQQSDPATRNAEDLAVLIYTSGTTGEPKGVMLSHRNLTSNGRSVIEYAYSHLKKGDAVLSVLPFAHIYEHLAIFVYLVKEFQYHLTVPENVLEDLRSVRPVAINLVPRICERVIAGIVSRARSSGGIQATLVPWALAIGRAYMKTRFEGRSPSFFLCLKYFLARHLVLKKLRKRLGLDRLCQGVSGSAAMHPDIALTFASADIIIYQGYGLTETSPGVSINRPEENRFGTVGHPLPGVEVRIASDGEILVRGPNVMMGYYHRPGEAPIDSEGWFSTGDIGFLDAEGFLSITDRKKELMKTTGGKYISPSRIESAIKRSMYISQVIVVGHGRPHPAALVVPNWDLVSQDFGLEYLSSEQIAAREDVRDFICREVYHNTIELAPFEQVLRVALFSRDLTIEEGELSPTLKVRRRFVESQYAGLVESVYALEIRSRGDARP